VRRTCDNNDTFMWLILAFRALTTTVYVIRSNQVYHCKPFTVTWGHLLNHNITIILYLNSEIRSMWVAGRVYRFGGVG